MNEKRLCSVIFHELCHSCGSYEFDAEVLENLVFSPDEGGAGKGGGTWPFKDCTDFCARTKPRSDRLRESEYYLWDPTTGQVWEKTSTGDKGRQLWDDPAILARWRCDCPEREEGEAPPGGVLVDPIEPGSFPAGYSSPGGGAVGETVPGSEEHVLIDPIEPGSFPRVIEVIQLSARLARLEHRMEALHATLTEVATLTKRGTTPADHR